MRPLEESEKRISKLRKTLEKAEEAMGTLGVLLAAEQQRLSVVFANRRNLFLRQAQQNAPIALSERLFSMKMRRNGPALRREINHLAQEIARAQLTPWLEEEARYADGEFRKTARRFVELGNDFLRRLNEAGILGLEELPEEVSSDQGLCATSQFHFHVIERVAAPASPFIFVSDLVMGAFGLREGIIRDAQDFLRQLLEINSSRVPSDVDERVRETRTKLEIEIKGVTREASAVADRALSRAKAAQAAGTPAVQAALAHLDSAEREVRAHLAAY